MTDIETRDMPLSWDVFVTPGIPLNITSDLPPGAQQWMWSPISATLISGQRDAVLVDALMTVEQAHALVEWVEAHGKNLTTIYLTHGHGDHCFGIGALLERFPTARAVATPAVVKFMRQQASPASIANFWNARFPGQIPNRLVIAEELKGKVLDLEGRDLVVVEVGHSDTDDTTCLHVPSIGLVVAGDVAYNDVHLNLGESNARTRREWIAALDTIEALHPRAVIAGHKRPGNDDGTRAVRPDAFALSGSGQSGRALGISARDQGLSFQRRKTMYALQISTFGEPSDVVERVEIPDPGAPTANEVLVAVEYAPINPSELMMIRAQYGLRPSLPTGLGNEGVGRILSVGEEVNHLKVGDRVLISSFYPSWRERLVLPATDLFPLPQGADPQQLSMLGINPPTAALLLSEYVQLAPGDWVIQNAGNSGVGRSVIAFARERGLRTVSLVRRQELIDELVAAGGDIVLVDGAGVSARVAQATGNAQLALALDGVGGEAMLSLSGSLTPGGTLVVYSAMSSKPGLANVMDIVFRKVTIRGFWLFYPEFRASPKALEASKTGARLIAEGKLHMPVAATYPLVAAKEAIAHAQSGGKVLFKLS